MWEALAGILTEFWDNLLASWLEAAGNFLEDLASAVLGAIAGDVGGYCALRPNMGSCRREITPSWKTFAPSAWSSDREEWGWESFGNMHPWQDIFGEPTGLWCAPPTSVRYCSGLTRCFAQQQTILRDPPSLCMEY